MIEVHLEIHNLPTGFYPRPSLVGDFQTGVYLRLPTLQLYLVDLRFTNSIGHRLDSRGSFVPSEMLLVNIRFQEAIAIDPFRLSNLVQVIQNLFVLSLENSQSQLQHWNKPPSFALPDEFYLQLLVGNQPLVEASRHPVSAPE